MKLLIVSLMSVFLFSSCSVHVYHHKDKRWKKGMCEKCVQKLCQKCKSKVCDKCIGKSDCSTCKTGKDCKDCDQKSECTTGYCPLKKGKKSGKKPCCNS